jgi:cellulose synthase operon protein B
MEVREVKMTFAALGAGPMELRGAQPIGAVNIGTRTDELIVAAKLHLRMTYSPAMLSDLSHVRVSLNGQVLAALPLPREQAGREVEREVELDADPQPAPAALNVAVAGSTQAEHRGVALFARY